MPTATIYTDRDLWGDSEKGKDGKYRGGAVGNRQKSPINPVKSITCGLYRNSHELCRWPTEYGPPRRSSRFCTALEGCDSAERSRLSRRAKCRHGPEQPFQPTSGQTLPTKPRPRSHWPFTPLGWEKLARLTVRCKKEALPASKLTYGPYPALFADTPPPPRSRPGRSQ